MKGEDILGICTFNRKEIPGILKGEDIVGIYLTVRPVLGILKGEDIVGMYLLVRTVLGILKGEVVLVKKEGRGHSRNIFLTERKC